MKKTPLRILGPALLLAALPLACGEDEAPMGPPASDLEACQQNLRAVYAGLRAYADARGGAPEASGVGFFAALITSGTWEDTAENAERLTCPGEGARRPPGDPTEWFDGELDGTRSAYAGRDLEAYPLPAFPTAGTEILMACDNADGMNHDGALNALFADGSIKILSLQAERERGRLGPEDDVLAVGPDSPHPDLAKIALD